MLTRPYGNTGIDLSVVGFGGTICRDEEQEKAAEIVAQAVDKGVNYFDVAPRYGTAQEILGPALEPHRKSVFLACKTGQRKAAEAQEDLEESLRLLRTDHFDLYQFHGVSKMEDVEAIFSPGGAMETFEKAQTDGRIRNIGFSAHSEEAALAMMDRYDFASILFPINWVVWNTGRFGPRVVETAHEKGLAILALKSLAKRLWREGERETRPELKKVWYHPVESYEEAEMALRFTLSRPVTAAVSPGVVDYLWWAIEAAENFSPLSDKEEERVAERAKDLESLFPRVAA